MSSLYVRQCQYRRVASAPSGTLARPWPKFSPQAKVDGHAGDMKLLALTAILFRAGSVLCQFPFANQNLAGNLPIPKPTDKPDIWNKLFVVSSALSWFQRFHSSYLTMIEKLP